VGNGDAMAATRWLVMMETMMLARATTMIARMMVLANNVNRQNQGKYSLFFFNGTELFSDAI